MFHICIFVCRYTVKYVYSCLFYIISIYIAVLGNDLVACTVLPVILPLLTHKTLAPQQFTMIVALTKSLLSEILNSRANELGLPPVDLGAVTSMGHSGSGSSTYNYDPFTAAKDMIVQASAAREREVKASSSGNRAPTGIVSSSSSGYTGPTGVAGSAGPTDGMGGTMDPGIMAGMGGAPPPPPSAPAPSMLPPPPPSAPPPSTAPIPGSGGAYRQSPSPQLTSSNSTYTGGPKAVVSTNDSNTSIQDSTSWYSAAASAVGSVFVLPAAGGAGDTQGNTQPPAPTTYGATPPVAKVIGMNAPPAPTSTPGYGGSASAPAPPAPPSNLPPQPNANTDVNSGFSWMQSTNNSTGTGAPPPLPGSNAPGMGHNQGLPMGQTSIMGGGEPDINVDDFMSSFSGGGGGGMGMNMGGSTSAANSTGGMGGMGMNMGGSNTNTGAMGMGGMGGMGAAPQSLSIEQQIAQTQAEISRLSSAATTGTGSTATTGSSNSASPIPAIPAINKPPHMHTKSAYSSAKYSGGSTWSGSAVGAGVGSTTTTPPLGAGGGINNASTSGVHSSNVWQ